MEAPIESPWRSANRHSQDNRGSNCSAREEWLDIASLRLKPGTRLIRRWHGNVHHVLILDEGLEHEGRRYQSLSQIARAITGAQWSGPRFFGLRPRMGGTANG